MMDEAELRDGYAEIGDVRLHYVEAGDGPLIVLLHGFPEYWYGWRLQIAPLAAAGFRVVAPDMRGYNLSSKPAGVASYVNIQWARGHNPAASNPYAWSARKRRPSTTPDERWSSRCCCEWTAASSSWRRALRSSNAS